MSKEEAVDFDEAVKPVGKRDESKPVEIDTSKLLSPAFQKLRNDLNDAQIAEIRRLAPLRSYDIEIDGQVKTFERKKIKVRDYVAIEKKRALLAKEKDQVKQSEILFEIYADCSRLYLGMTQEEFDGADIEALRPILDTCNIVTTQGVPNS